MKKLLLFAILLAASTSVGATTNYYLTDSTGSSEMSLFPSDDVELLFWYTGDPIIAFDVEIDAIGPGTIWDGYVIAQNRNPEYDLVIFPSPFGGDVELTGSADEGTLGSGIANPLATVYFHCDGPGDVTFDFVDLNTFGPGWQWIDTFFNGMVIHQVPEPATMILLVLGGLLLRNKK